ncbi:MAG: heavy-metal-associated domain-containing protein [Candidatus Latescibacteria bacterium]|nr:heavy-metal-associated domain-containing protein [Candidatus Latescibacterota bacterium]
MRKTICIVLSSVFAFALVAVSGCSTAETRTAKIKVPTAQCMMCANKIDTTLKNVDGVKEVNVDMDTRVVNVTYDAKRTDTAAMEQAIARVGYQANQVPADSTAYASLPDCCKVPPSQ